MCTHLADEEHDWSLASTDPPHVVQTGHAVLDAQQELGTLQGSPAKCLGERERARERERLRLCTHS